MNLTWEVTDLEQTVLATLDDRREGCSVDLQLNGLWTAKAVLSNEDPAARLATAMDTCLRVKAEGWDRPVFLGRVLNPEASATADSEGFTLNAVSPWNHLEKSIICQDPDLIEPGLEAFLVAYVPIPGAPPRLGARFSETDQIQILWGALQASRSSGTGISPGTWPTSLNRDVVYQAGTRVSEAIEAMCDLLNGPDVELTPVEATDGTLAEFNGFYPRQGSDKTATVEITFGLDDSATEFSYSPSGDQFFNRFIAVGQAGKAVEGYPGVRPVYRADHLASQSQYGVHERIEEVSELGDSGSLHGYAMSAVAQYAYPIKFFSVTMAPHEGTDYDPPAFGPDNDFYLGDTVTCLAQLPGWDTELDLAGRVVAVSLEEKDSGAVVVKPTLAPELLSSGVSGAYESWFMLTTQEDIEEEE